MNLGLNNKKCLVLGASKGIGKETTIQLINEGAQVVAVARSTNLLEELSQKNDLTRNNLKIETYDVINSNCKDFAEHLLEKYGHFDIVIHCVGTSLTSRNVLDGKDEWVNSLNVNALHAIDINSVIVKDMIDHKINGHVLHVSSISGQHLRGNPQYACAKSFLNSYITVMGRELAKYNIVVNGVMPGAVSFENSYWDQAIKNNDPKVDDFLKHHQAIGRFGTTEEIASLILYLVSEKASFTNGCVMPIDGGTM